MKKRVMRITATIVMISVLVSSFVVTASAQTEDEGTNYPFIFVHGLFGWGNDDGLTKVFSHWGLTTGSIKTRMEYLGYDCYEVSTGTLSSAWDRSCELYAQLTGTTVDYGAAHSAEHNHARYGRTYSEPLIENWNSENKVNLVGHSFGGTTIRLFEQLLAEGCEAERAATPENELSGLFVGGKGDYVYSITALATPHEGTTFMYAAEDLMPIVRLVAFGVADLSEVIGITNIYDFQLEQFGLTPIPGDKEMKSFDKDAVKALAQSEDNMFYDLTLEGAAKLNEQIDIQEGIYYFSYAGSKTTYDVSTGNYVPEFGINLILAPLAAMVGKYRENTVNDIPIDETWLQNDGVVNTVSALYPFDEPFTEYDADNIETGVWNVMPIQNMDHLAFIGGVLNMGILTITKFYKNQFELICSL